MRDHSGHIQKDHEEAVGIIIRHCPVLRETETVPVREAAGRVLAEDVFAAWDSPNALTCGLDSVAVRWEDFKDGLPDTSAWKRGVQWEFANTGVAMPAGFDTAVPIETVRLSQNDTAVSFTVAPTARYDGTKAAGSRFRSGDLLVLEGTEITPLIAAYILGGNVTQVRVRKRPVVAFLPTGNELVHAGGEIPCGRNIESTSLVMAEKIRQWGGTPLVWDIVPDTREALREALTRAAGEADLVVLNAGSSKGSDDWGMETLEELGTVLFHEVNHGPGHHSSFALLDGTPVVGLPGPPDGAGFSADLYLYPAVRALLGQEPHLKKVKATLAEDFAKPGAGSGKKKRLFETGAFYVVKQMILRQAPDGLLEAYPPQGTHLNPLQAEGADAYYLLPTGADQKVPEKGSLIELELRPR